MKRIMGPLLDNAAIIHNQNAVGPADGGETMGNHNACAVCQGSLDSLFHKHFRFRIHVCGSFIQHQDSRVSGKDTGQGESKGPTSSRSTSSNGIFQGFRAAPANSPQRVCRF